MKDRRSLQSLDICSVVPTLTAARLPDSDLEGRPSGRGVSSLSPSSPGVGPLLIAKLAHPPLHCCFFVLSSPM